MAHGESLAPGNLARVGSGRRGGRPAAPPPLTLSPHVSSLSTPTCIGFDSRTSVGDAMMTHVTPVMPLSVRLNLLLLLGHLELIEA